MRLHGHGFCDGMEICRGCIKRRQQCLFLFVKKILATTVPASIVGTVVSQNFVSIPRVIRKWTNQGSALADNLEPATVRLREF